MYNEITKLRGSENMKEKKITSFKATEEEILRLDFLANVAKYEIEKENEYLFEVNASRTLALSYFMKKATLGLGKNLNESDASIIINNTFKQPTKEIIEIIEKKEKYIGMFSEEKEDAKEIYKIIGIRVENLKEESIVYILSHEKFENQFLNEPQYCSAYYVKRYFINNTKNIETDYQFENIFKVKKNDEEFEDSSAKENIISKEIEFGKALEKFVTHVD